MPFDSDTIGNPALDLGDVLTFSGGQADEDQITCITSIKYTIGGRQTLKCVGKNPKLSQAKSKNDKNISGLLSQIEEGKMGLYTYTNASAYTIADSNTKIISMEFTAKEATYAVKAGKLRSIGVANFEQPDIDSLLSGCTIRPVINQLLAHISNIEF